MNNQFWQKWLFGVAGAVILYASGLILLPNLMHRLFNTLFFSDSDSIERILESEGQYVHLIYGVLGAVIIGWMVGLLPLIRKVNQREAWNNLVWSIGVWFVVDTGFSLYIGSVSHALFNLPFLILFALPLWRINPC